MAGAFAQRRGARQLLRTARDGVFEGRHAGPVGRGLGLVRQAAEGEGGEAGERGCRGWGGYVLEGGDCGGVSPSQIQLSFDDISPRLPARYEDLDASFRGSLKPNDSLIEATKAAFRSIAITGGIRFLPIFGRSGSGKSCATLELATHLPEIEVMKLDEGVVDRPETLAAQLGGSQFEKRTGPLVAVVDQYEEAAKGKEKIPTQFVEKLAALDASYRGRPVLVIWLTTSEEFRDQLVEATSRRTRILVTSDFEISGPARSEWPAIVAQTFSAHNSGKELADFEVLEAKISDLSTKSDTIGSTILAVAEQLASHSRQMIDLSDYQVIMLWPVTDGQRIQTLNTFSSPRQGYRVNWHAFYNQLNSNDKTQLPLSELNKARLYFDVRLVPISAADLKGICSEIGDDPKPVIQSSIDRFGLTHLVNLLKSDGSEISFSPLRERPGSERGTQAVAWYRRMTRNPVGIGKEISRALSRLNFTTQYEATETTPHSSIRADVLVTRAARPTKVMIELKAYSPENTRPSDVSSQIRITLTKMARFAGFIQRQ